MFNASEFNGNISNWNVGNVKNINLMFFGSKFNGKSSTDWNHHLKLISCGGNDIFKNNTGAQHPYWSEFTK